MKKMNRFVSMLALTLSAIALPQAGHAADGDIVEIRAVDVPGSMVFGTRNATSPDLCTMENPLIAGDEVYFRVRMLVRNYKKIHSSPFDPPQEWSFQPNTPSASLLNMPALGLFIGDRAVYATYSETGPNWWQKSGTLECDDAGSSEGSKKTDYTHFTDLYFYYKVQAGDIGLPLVLMNSNRGKASATDDNTDYFLLNCALTAGDVLSPWRLVSTTVKGEIVPAVFHYGEETLDAAWPTGSLTDGPVRNFDLATEGVFIKTVDFDSVNAKGEPWSEGEVWRNVYPGLPDAPMTLPALSVPGGAKTDGASVVWIWSEDESVFLPVKDKNSEIDEVDGYHKLKLTIPAGAESVTFTLKGADGAKVGSVTNIVMSSSRSKVTLEGGKEIGVTMKRLVRVVEAPEPTVKIFIDAKETVQKSVIATPEYTKCETRLMLTVSPVSPQPVSVLLNAKIGNVTGFQTLDAIYNDDLIRIAEGDFGGDPIDQELTRITIPANTSMLPLNLYVLGATTDTDQKGVTFSLAADGTPPAGVKVDDKSNCTLNIKKSFKPVIVSANPEFAAGDQDGTVRVISGTAKTFTLDIQDTYRNLNLGGENGGYTFIFKAENEEGTDESGASTPGVVSVFNVMKNDEGYFSTDGMDPIFYGIAPSGKELTLQVKAPNGTKSEVVNYNLVVTDSKKVTIERTEERIVFGEGESTYVKLGLTQGYTGTGVIFFEGGDVTNYATNQLLFTEGISIDRGKTKVPDEIPIDFLDGRKDVAIKAALYTSADKKTKAVGYSDGELTFTITNKPPTIMSVDAAGQYVTPDMAGTTLRDPISRGVLKSFSVTVDDVPADKYVTGDNALKVKWRIDGTEYGPTNALEQTSDGAWKPTSVQHTFRNEKDNALVQIYVWDKDMSEPVTPSMSFYVKVKDTPRVMIRTSAIGGKFLETDKSVSTITVELTEPATEQITVRFKVSQATDHGYLKIRQVEGSVAKATELGEYDLTFEAGVLTKELVVEEMDGTNDTMGGLDLNARVTTDKANDDGVVWSNFYTKAEAVLIRVQNVAPEIIRPTEAEAAYTNENASANVPYPIHYGCNDVVADFATGVTVQVSIDGTAVFTTNMTSSAVGSYEATFEGEGAHVVEVSFTDKDQMISRRTLNYFVKPSKRLQLRAHGPAGALGTSGGYSMHYGAASGLGAGRVYAGEKGPQQIKNFVHLYSFAEVETAISAYAVGYQVGDIDDGQLQPFNDAAIDTDGNTYDSKKSTSHYNYTNDVKYASVGRLGFDSFLYGWACNNTESSNSQTQNAGGGTTQTTMSFLLNIGKYGETVIPLPATDGKNDNSKTTAYPMQYWEAVFSRELFKPDNCGDINLDGVPDIAVYRFGLGIVDTATYQLIAGGEGGNTEGDLTDVSEFNKDVDKDGAEDPDYLPSTETAIYAAFIPGLKGTWASVGRPFGARLEIRGYHDGLNDALAQLGITGYQPTSVYAEGVEVEPGVTNWVWTKACTISELEFAAWSEFAAANGYEVNEWANADGTLRWSPERPTNPMKSDTDGDGFTDGYEYYFWYKAHVGYMENGVHKYLTGRRYDPRNPGEGTLITSEEIASLMDPLVKSGDASSAEIRDTDNDGLPDLLEFELGTNPFDFDTDGDGLPDGWELCNVGNLDPLDPASHLDGKSDTERNTDGDAMAISSYALEKLQTPVPFDFEHAKRTTFAVIDPNGDTDGVQWYAVKGAPEDVAVTAVTNAASVWSFESEGRFFVSIEKPALTADGRLAKTFAKGVAFVSAKPEELITPIPEEEQVPEGPTETTNFVAAALYPVRLAAGTAVANLSDKEIDGVVTTLAADIAAADANACWIYGRGSAEALYGEVAKTAADYGCLALGRNLAAKKGARVVALPDDKRDVAFLHYLVYQEFGFDPRTAWCAADPLGSRWAASGTDGEAFSGTVAVKQGGYAGIPARTREYANYDEFLVYSFFVNNGCDMTGTTRITDPNAPGLIKIWDAFTTNPQGPNEKVPESEGDETTVASYGRGENGCDTDGDGVPDGWELYIMAGPKMKNGAYVFAPPYAGFSTTYGNPPESFWSPFVDAANSADTANPLYVMEGGVIDDLTELREFSGVDSCAWYAGANGAEKSGYSTTILRREMQVADANNLYKADDSKWLNKFFPTDPWNNDTDGDGIVDSAEKSAFAYGTPGDDGKLWSIPGGGLNPCSVDTDGDGLPDGWELQFKPVNYENVYAGDDPKPFRVKGSDGNEIGNPLEGLTDGMDGTVPDAYNVVNGDESDESSKKTTWTVITLDGRRWSGHVNRDYDRDGLENWQEYLVGTMRCWRYDDPVSPWTFFDESVYFDKDGIFDAVRSAEILGIGGDDDDEKAAAFWYETLVNSTGAFYNPHFVTGSSPAAQYFSRVMNVWDTAYLDADLSGKKVDGAYYYFKDRVGANKIEDTWAKILPLPVGSSKSPSKYISCSPISRDTDADGMDDYYELFHGLNPLLGASGVKNEGNPCDIVYDAWCGTSALEAYGKGDTENYWQRNPWKTPRGENGMDFEVFPYLAGLQKADPDGDDIFNDIESLQTRLNQIGTHTDPTPLWMTDSSYSNSLTRLHYRVPMRLNGIVPHGEGFTYNDVEYKFSHFEGWGPVGLGMGYMPFNIDSFWKVTAEDTMNWMFSFEENEGFDTDHDALGDNEERTGLYRSATDPLDADSPRRRQAMYFPGADAALQTMPETREEYPVATKTWPTDPSFLNFTVECWAMPERLDDQTVVERAIWIDPSNAGDQEYLRKNFQIAMRGGKWFAKYDSGTLTNDEVKAFSKDLAEVGKWAHLAATFDGKEFRFYVDGTCQNGDMCGVKTLPEYGSSAMAFVKGTSGDAMKSPGSYGWDHKYDYKAILVGASFKGHAEGGKPAALDVTSGAGWSYYKDFFKGYVDEIRIWDGARTIDEIQADLSKRYAKEDAAANRTSFYDQWVNGERRYEKATAVRVTPELRYHFHFDSVPGAADADSVMKVPTGFQTAGGKPVISRPVGYAIDWFAKVADAYGTVYGPDRDWIQWIPNTVAHLPRFDGTTIDSFFWSKDYSGAKADENPFENSAEPVSRWTQMAYNGVNDSAFYKASSMRHHFVYEVAGAVSNAASTAVNLYRFTGRHLNQMGDDLLPLGGAFVKYAPNLWDEQGSSAQWEHTGVDANGNGLPDWYEGYVRSAYDLEGEISPDTDVMVDGRLMKVRDLYLRDLARGIVCTADGMSGEFSEDRRQIADFDKNGIPDWWAEFYRIDGESGLDDHDNDGLPNYVEYLLSEEFKFGVFSPTVYDSVQPGVPDYFYRPAGCQLYVGEIFTDHDLVDDAWEALYDSKYASRLAWDAFDDEDQDGWSNRSENRYAKAVMPIVADKQTHYTAADGLVADYPIPTLNLTLSYNGNRQDTVREAPIAVQVTTDATLEKDPDATYQIGAAVDMSAGTGTDSQEGAASSGSTETSHTRTIGKWSNRHAIGTLTPGNIKQNSLALQFCYDPSSVIYTWEVRLVHINSSYETRVKRGTRAEYDADKRKYGDNNVMLISESTDYAELQDLELRSDEQSALATWVHTKSGLTLGTVNLVTGEFDLNLGVFKDQYVVNGTNENDYASLEDQTFRIAYAANPSVGLPRSLYLGEADAGHVKEGKNTIVAWAETVAADGVWQVGEPYGIVRDVDVSWRGTSAEIELTDLSPVTPRIDLIAAGGSGGESKGGGQQGESSGGNPDEVDTASDRGKTVSGIKAKLLADLEYAYSGASPAVYSNALNRLNWIDGNRIETAAFTAEEFRGQRLRVVRWLINGVPAYRTGSNMRVVLDKKIETDVRSCLTEADFLVGNENVFDLDWNDLDTEVISKPGVIRDCGDVTNLCYLIVVGDGPTDWGTVSTSNYVVKALNTVIVRKFGKTHVKPVAVAPGALGEGIVYSANPTFKWTMDCPEDEGYTAFNVQVMDGTKVIYDSGKQLAPPRNIEGQYVWSAPLFVGDKTLKGEVFENKKDYTWKVSMYNAKFSAAANYSNAERFRMQVQTNGYECGSANVAVRYYGPTNTWAMKSPVIRVRAYASPDFTGVPVAAGYVTDPATVTDLAKTPNCTVFGIPLGTYYLQAFIDSNGDGVCDPWETQGYLCTRDGTTADYLDPTTITIDRKIGAIDSVVIYLEDADTDGDGLPDAWEYAESESGSLMEKGVELLDETKAGEFVVNSKLSSRAVEAAFASAMPKSMNNAFSSPMGVSLMTGIDPADLTRTSGGFEVKSEIDPETLTIVGFNVDAANNRVILKVGAETTANVDASVASFLSITVAKGASVTIKVKRSESPNGSWTPVKDANGNDIVGTVTVDKAGADFEVKLSGELPAQGFFRAVIEE